MFVSFNFLLSVLRNMFNLWECVCVCARMCALTCAHMQVSVCTYMCALTCAHMQVSVYHVRQHFDEMQSL